MRKFEFHLDALIAVTLVLGMAASFIIFQRYQYSEVLQDNIDLVWENENLKVDLVLEKALFDGCQRRSGSEQAMKADRERTNPEEQ